jgi:hypothetical protein
MAAFPSDKNSTTYPNQKEYVAFCSANSNDFDYLEQEEIISENKFYKDFVLPKLNNKHKKINYIFKIKPLARSCCKKI